MMRISDLPVVVETVTRYASYRRRGGRSALVPVLEPVGGRTELTGTDRRVVIVADAGLRRVGVRCLARAVVITEMLRRRGVDASVALTIDGNDPRDAHADVAVGGKRLRPDHRVPLQ